MKLIIGIINIHIKANKYEKLHQDLKMKNDLHSSVVLRRSFNLMPDIPASALWWQRCEPSKLQFLVKNQLFRKIYFVNH